MAKIITNHSDRQIVITSEMICVKCFTRIIYVRPAGTLQKNLWCDKCNLQGLIIETGQEWADIEKDPGKILAYKKT